MWVQIQESSSIDPKDQRLVGDIVKGFVVDHITQGVGRTVYDLLCKRCGYIGFDPKRDRAVLLINAKSTMYGIKDLIKIENIHPTENEIGLIAIIAPTATILEIENGKIANKYQAKLPGIIPPGILKCRNPTCITYDGREPSKAKFKVRHANSTTSLQCLYCGNVTDVKEDGEESLLKYLDLRE